MDIVVSLNQTDCRRWLLALVQRLEAAGHGVSFRVRADDTAPDRVIDRLLGFEALAFGKGGNAWDALDPARLPKTPAGRSAIVLELSRDGVAVPDGERHADFHLVLDGSGGIGGVARILSSKRIPFVEIRDSKGDDVVAALPAVEQPDVLGRALEQFLIRIGTLIVMALDGQARSPSLPVIHNAPSTTFDPYLYGVRAFCAKVANRLLGSRLRADHWRVGIRGIDGPQPVDGDTLIEGFKWLADDGQRYYADPILWSDGDRNWLFVEEFPYASERGIISFTELDSSGQPLFTPRPIIERSTHLSYPFLFEHEGRLYMMPENAAENHVPLYRAKRFPDLWEEVAPLLPGIGLHDATLFSHDGAWWLLGNEALHGGSSWDCLMIFRGETPLGPFSPHPANPVLVDARIARPGGPVLAINGRLVRPVQSCLGGYGRFTRFVEIEALSMTEFRQRERGRMLAPLHGPIAGVHTYSRSSRFEAVDALTPRIFRG